MNKPIIVYVDDEQRNLTVFEASMPEEWEVKCFESAIEALKALKELKPALIVSDQKMPHMTGLEFLEVASQILPNTVRIIVTGQTEESTIVQLIRRAKIFDYITKPWNADQLLAQMTTAISYHQAMIDRDQAIHQLNCKNAELASTNDELRRTTKELAEANAREVELRNEIVAWTPAAVVNAIKQKTMDFPARRNIVGITYDIIQSSALAGILVEGRPVKSHVIRLFTEALLKKGGMKESSTGDSVYGHFGAVGNHQNPHMAAMTAAQEFRVSLRSFSKLHNIEIECGIALHYAPDTVVQIHEVKVQTTDGEIIQKSFDTDSTHIDLLHRMEKLVHALPGSNIVMSDEFLKGLGNSVTNTVELGSVLLKGQKSPVKLHLIASDRVKGEVLEQFMKTHMTQGKDLAEKAAA